MSERKIDGYGKISFNGISMTVPGHLPDGKAVSLHIIPDKQFTEICYLDIPMLSATNRFKHQNHSDFKFGLTLKKYVHQFCYEIRSNKRKSH